MKQIFLSSATELLEIDTFAPGAWINLVNPSQSETMEVANRFNIDITDLRASLDAEEMSRISVEDDYTLIIVDVPILEERNDKTYYITIPLGILITEDAIITVSLQELPLLDVFTTQRQRDFFTFMKSRFVFQILFRNVSIYLAALRQIERQSEIVEKRLHESTRNEELIELMELGKTIVYFQASLKSIERIVKKLIASSRILKKYEEDEDLLEDTLIDTQQALEMAGIYGNILTGMSDAFASIIANNQNVIMKALALFTILLEIPTMVFSAYGMNVLGSSIPLSENPHGFLFVTIIAFLLIIPFIIYFIYKKWF